MERAKNTKLEGAAGRSRVRVAGGIVGQAWSRRFRHGSAQFGVVYGDYPEHRAVAYWRPTGAGVELPPEMAQRGW
jgi:hypothetical protein